MASEVKARGALPVTASPAQNGPVPPAVTELEMTSCSPSRTMSRRLRAHEPSFIVREGIHAYSHLQPDRRDTHLAHDNASRRRPPAHGTRRGSTCTADRANGSADYARLAARFSADASAHSPRCLFLKCNDPERPAERWRRVNEPEVAINEAFRSSADIPAVPYPKLSRGDGADMRRFPFVPCYAAGFDPDTCRSHLLFADMTPTHRRWQDIPQPMSLGTFEEHLACLARLHAAMWEHPRLHEFGTPRVGAEGLDRSDERLARVRVVAPADSIHVIEDLASDDRWPSVLANMAPVARLTLVHGDSIGNVLYPRDTASGHEAVLIDWQSHSAGQGADDLAFFLIKAMAPSHRRRVESALLDSYHEALCRYGVRDYAYDALRDDYCRAITRFLSCELFHYESWGEDLPRALAAFVDNDCFAVI